MRYEDKIKKEMVSPAAAAGILGIDYALMRRIVLAGAIEAYDVTPESARATYRIPMDAIMAFKRAHRIVEGDLTGLTEYLNKRAGAVDTVDDSA